MYFPAAQITVPVVLPVKGKVLVFFFVETA
jgi:hypothetical protein